MKMKTLIAVPLIALIAACSSGSHSSSNGGRPGTPAPTAQPKSESIADLATFAAESTAQTNSRGATTRTRSYTVQGETRTVTLAGDEDTGLLSQTYGGTSVQQHTLIGKDTSRNVNLQANYSAEASGSLRVRNGETTDAVRGTASIGMNTETGQWLFGSDLWRESGDSGVYVGIDDGTVRGNTMVFDPSKSAVVELTPTAVKSLDDKAGAEALFSNDGQKVFGKITGSNAATGFEVNAGFAGSADAE